MSREFPMFGLRMPPELRESVSREAQINGRSLNAEIVDRLKKSLEPTVRNEKGLMVEQSVPVYGNQADVNDIERKLLTVFRRLPVEKQLALVSLFN